MPSGTVISVRFKPGLLERLSRRAEELGVTKNGLINAYLEQSLDARDRVALRSTNDLGGLAARTHGAVVDAESQVAFLERGQKLAAQMNDPSPQDAPVQFDVWSENAKRHYHQFSEPVRTSIHYINGLPYAFHKCECGEVSDKRDRLR